MNPSPKLPLILLVEDDTVNAFVVMKFLENFYRISHAVNGPEAMTLLETNTYAMVLMDINLGEEKFDGVEALRRIRQNPEWQDLKVMALTAYAMAGDKEKFLEEGFDAYLAKPIKRDQLLQEMEKMME